MNRWGTSCSCGWEADSYSSDLVWEAFGIHYRLFPDHDVSLPYMIED